MKTIFLACLLTALSFTHSNGYGSTVYISTGNKAYAYHSKKNCRTIKHCVEEGHVKELLLEDAIKMGRKPCKVCTFK